MHFYYSQRFLMQNYKTSCEKQENRPAHWNPLKNHHGRVMLRENTVGEPIEVDPSPSGARRLTCHAERAACRDRPSGGRMLPFLPGAREASGASMTTDCD